MLPMTNETWIGMSKTMRLWAVLLLLAAGVSTGRAEHESGGWLDGTLQYVPRAAVCALYLSHAESATKDQKHYFVNTIGSTLLSTCITWACKSTIHEWRPDNTDRRSFFSGHTSMAFSGAHILHKEYGHLSPWISIGGYTIAAAVATSRVARERHHPHDVLVGAAVGILSTELVYHSSNRWFKNKGAAVAITPNEVAVRVGF